MRIVVGSKNPVKLAAVRQAFFRAFPDRPLVCVGHDVPSGVSDQPWGHAETRTGALQRARGALLAETGADYAVGIEGGVVGEVGLRSVAYVAIRRVATCGVCRAHRVVQAAAASGAPTLRAGAGPRQTRVGRRLRPGI